MPNLVSTIYPPQLATFAKAFVYNQDVKIPVGISPYNNIGDIKSVHVTVTNQLNNENALNVRFGMLFLPLEVDSNGNTFVTIPVAAMQNYQFSINQFYKVQMRFDSNTDSAGWNSMITTGGQLNEQAILDKLLNDQEYFSEWSTVCLVRGILAPKIVLTGFPEGTVPAFNKGIIPISGKLFFMKKEGGDEASRDETETLQSYNIEVFLKSTSSPVLSTPTIYTGGNVDPNTINYRIDLQGLNNLGDGELTLTINFVTKNQYQGSQDFEFTIADFLEEESFQPIIEVKVDNENGIAAVHVTNRETVFGTLYIKRGSSIDNFTSWEDVYVDTVRGPIDLEIEDNTIGSLVWYRYSAQLENSKKALTQIFRSDQIFPDFHDLIISRGDQALKLYDCSVSSVRPTVNRTKIDTLGGKYPKFAENAVLNYKQYSVSGILSSEADPNQKFLKKQKFYSATNYARYQKYLQDYDVESRVRNDVQDYVKYNAMNEVSYLTTTAQDWLWERDFRDQAVKWLNDGEPKLMRSMTEGNAVIMITDVNLTPNEVLGRRLYQFSATFYEVAEGESVAVLDELGVYPVHYPPENEIGNGTGDNEFIITSKPATLHNLIIPSNNSIFSLIMENLEARYSGVLSDKKPDSIILSNVKIYFESEPHIYYMGNGQQLEEIVKNSTGGYNLTPDKDPKRIRLGYVINLTTDASSAPRTIFVDERGYYQVPGNVNIQGLSLLNVGDKVHIEFVMTYKERNNSSNIISSSSVAGKVLGQDRGVYAAGRYLGDYIRRKYDFTKTDEYSQRMQYWAGISIEAPPFTVVSINYQKQTEYIDYVIGFTGVLNMLKDFPVQEMRFLGRKMQERNFSRQKYLKQYEYVYDPSGTNYTSVIEIQKPQVNTVYMVKDAYKIYYTNSNWYDFEPKETGFGLAKVPTEALINYTGTVLRSAF